MADNSDVTHRKTLHKESRADNWKKPHGDYTHEARHCDLK